MSFLKYIPSNLKKVLYFYRKGSRRWAKNTDFQSGRTVLYKPLYCKKPLHYESRCRGNLHLKCAEYILNTTIATKRIPVVHGPLKPTPIVKPETSKCRPNRINFRTKNHRLAPSHLFYSIHELGSRKTIVITKKTTMNKSPCAQMVSIGIPINKLRIVLPPNAVVNTNAMAPITLSTSQVNAFPPFC